MNTIIRYATFLVMSLWMFSVYAQKEEKTVNELSTLGASKEKIVNEERNALKKAVEAINAKIAKAAIDKEEAQRQKEALAKKHAANIEDRIQILENKYALLRRNTGDSLSTKQIDAVVIGLGAENGNDYLFGINIKTTDKKPKYDKRTYSGPVIAIGFNNALIEGQVLDNSPYKFGGSRFFEIGWNWRTRVLKNTNLLRFNYGVSLQFNGLKPMDNKYFVNRDGQTVLEEFPFELKKSKFRMDNLVLPLHVEFGDSETKKTEEQIRYETTRKFKFGIGGYVGFGINTRQKLKYTNASGERIKEKVKRNYNRSGLVYGLSSYIGVGDTSLYVKYDLSPIFKNAIVEQHNIAFGIRFDL